jgi:hypothetical protein
MSNYTITSIKDGVIVLNINGNNINFPLPIVNGLYPEGIALTTLLDSYYDNYIAAQTPVIATNEAALQSLITPPTVNDMELAIRRARNRLLALTDKTQLPDSPAAPISTNWATYREALRNLPTQSGFPTTVVWPIPPSVITNPFGVAITNADGSPVTQ